MMTVLNITGRLNRWLSYRNAYRALSSLDSRTLDDLGIMPGDIKAIARKAVR
jgi:uncharacterized protein YjiS (DUF1127 family)